MNFSTSEDKKGLWPPKVGQWVKALTPAGSDYLLGVVKKLHYHSRWSSFWNQLFEDLKYITLIGTDQRSHTYAVSNVFSVKRSEIPTVRPVMTKSGREIDKYSNVVYERLHLIRDLQAYLYATKLYFDREFFAVWKGNADRDESNFDLKGWALFEVVNGRAKRITLKVNVPSIHCVDMTLKDIVIESYRDVDKLYALESKCDLYTMSNEVPMFYIRKVKVYAELIKIRRAYISAMQKLPLETYYPQDTYETFGFRRK
jgi:hypothetical protein